MARIVEEYKEFVPPTLAQQIFTIGSGIAGGLAGFLLAKEFAQVEDVPTPALAAATVASAIATFGAAMLLARAARKGE